MLTITYVILKVSENVTQSNPSLFSCSERFSKEKYRCSRAVTCEYSRLLRSTLLGGHRISAELYREPIRESSAVWMVLHAESPHPRCMFPTHPRATEVGERLPADKGLRSLVRRWKLGLWG